MTDVLALDLASVTGWARGVPGSEPTCGSIRFAREGASTSAIFGKAMEWLIDLTAKSRPELIVYEAPLPGSWTAGRTNQRTNFILTGLCGVVEGVAWLRKIYDVRSASVNDVRRHFIDMNTVVNREEAKMMVQRKCRSLGWMPENDDAADALATWSYMCTVLVPETGLRVSPLFNRAVRV